MNFCVIIVDILHTVGKVVWTKVAITVQNVHVYTVKQNLLEKNNVS